MKTCQTPAQNLFTLCSIKLCILSRVYCFNPQKSTPVASTSYVKMVEVVCTSMKPTTPFVCAKWDSQESFVKVKFYLEHFTQ